MKSLYLILATAAVIASCAPQFKKNDIIWYPVDDEDGVFISTIGEKHRTTQNSKWRSHRRARYSGMEPSWPFDPTENQDPSFFHNINQRRPLISIQRAPKVPHSFHNQELPFNRPRERPQGQRNQNDNLQDIYNEVFGPYNKYVSASEYPETNYQWANTNQWGGNLVNNNQWNRPQQWDSTSGFTTNGLPWQQPVISNQWGSTTTSRPTEAEWISQTNTNRPTKRPTNQPDKLVFPEEDSGPPTTTSASQVPMDPTTLSPCERLCPVTPEFNPVCGSDGTTYSNAGRLKCAQSCGKDVKHSHHGRCGRTPFITPLVSNNPRRVKNPPIFSQFW